MASTNRDIKMRIFLEAGNAEKAYNSFMQRIEKNQARMAELKKQGQSGSDEYKTLREEAKIMKELVKMTQQTYEDLGKSVQNVNSKAIFELEGLIKQVNKRIRTLMPGKDDAELSDLSNKLGVFQRELAQRNQQIKEGAMRTYKEVMNDVNTSQEHLAEMSRQSRAVAIARNDEEVALKRLKSAEESYQRRIVKAAEYEQNRLAVSEKILEAQKGLDAETLSAINKQIAAEELLYKKQNVRASEKTKPNYVKNLEAAQATVDVEQNNVTAVVAAHNADAVAVARLISLNRENIQLSAKPVKTPDAGKHAKEMADKQAEIEKYKQVRIAAEEAYKAIQEKAGNDKPFQHSIETLKRLREELRAIRDTEMDVASRNGMNAQIQAMDRAIADMETHLMKNAEVQEIYKRAVDEISKGTSANSATLRENIELMKTAQKSKEIDAEMNARLASAIQFSTKLLESEGHSFLNIEQASKAYYGAKTLIAQGEQANVDQLRQYIAIMEQAQKIEGLTAREKSAYAGVTKQMTELLNLEAKEYISIGEADSIYLDGIRNTVGSIQQAIEAYKHYAQAKDTDAAKAAEYNTKAKELSDILTKQKEATIGAGEADRIMASSLQLLNDPLNQEAAELRGCIEQMKLIQRSEGISVKQNQEAVRIEKLLTDALTGKGKALMDAATAQGVYNQAQNLISQGENADASAVKSVIESLKQAQVAEGVSIKMANEYYQAEFRLNEMLRGKNTTVMTASEAADAYSRALSLMTAGADASASAVKKSIEEMERAKTAQGVDIKTAQDYAFVLDVLKKRLNGTSSSSLKVAYDTDFIRKTLNNISKAPIDDVKKALEMVDAEMKTLDRDTQLYANNVDKYKKLKAQLDEINKSLGKQQATVKKTTQEFQAQDTFFGKAMTKLASYLGIFGGFYLIRQQLQKAFEANIRFDESMSNIRKTTGLTSEAVAMLADNIKRINTRTSLDDMNALAYSAGRLGVKGVSDVMGFVRAADEIKIALGEQLGDSSEAIEQLMKINSLMGTTTQYGLEDGIRRTGSALNYLTMNSQATAQPMVDFMKRTSGIARQSGITTAELTGLAGAVNALGQNVEMSATSFSKMIVQISSNSKKVAKALQLNAEETKKFMYDISSGDMMSAFLTVLKKVNEGGGLSHLGVIVKDLGSEGQRVVQTIATLAKNYGTVESMVRMSNQAFKEGTSVTNEYNLKNATTAALFDKLKNNFSKLFVGSEAVDYIRELLMYLQDLPEKAKRIIMDFEPLLSILKALASIATWSTAALSGLLGAMMFRTAAVGIVNWILGITGSLAKFKIGLAAAEGGLNKFKFAMNSAFMGNVITAALTVVFTIINKIRESIEKSRMAMEDTVETLERIKDQSRTTTAEINKLLTELEDGWENTDKRKELIDQINQQYGSYLSNLVSENDSYSEIEKTLKRVNTQLQLKSLLEGTAQKEKEIRDNNANNRGSERLKLINAIVEEIEPAKQADGTKAKVSQRAMRSAASTIADMLLNKRSDGSYYADLIMARRPNKETGIDEYSTYQWMEGQDNHLYDNAIKRLRGMIDGAIADFGKDGVDIQLKGSMERFYSSIGENLEDYFEQIYNEESDIQRFHLEADAESMRTAKKVVESGFGKIVDAAWTPIQETVEQGGTFANKYVGADDKDYYITKKKSFKTGKERQEEEERVKSYLNVVDEMMQVYEGMGMRYKEGLPKSEENETDEYKLLRIRQANSNEYLRVLTVGNTEQKPEKNKGRNPGQDYYGDIIARIKTFYEHLGDEYKVMLNEGKITQADYERRMDDNTIQMHEMLKQARLRIIGKITKEEYEAALSVMNGQVMENGLFNTRSDYNSVAAMNDVYTSVGDPLRRMAKAPDEEGKKSSATLSGIKNEAAKDTSAQLEVIKKRGDALLKLLMENNPIGQLNETWQNRFEKMELMFMKLGGEDQKERQENERIAMGKMQSLGALSGKLDIDNEEDFATYMDTVMQEFPDFEAKWDECLANIAKANESNNQVLIAQANNAKLELLNQVKSLYYETYEYDRAIDEAIAKQVDKHKKLWEKMYKQGDAYQAAKDEIDDITEQYKYINRMQNFGFSSRTALARNVAVKQSELDLQNKIWYNNQAKAQQRVDAAQADKDAGKDGAEARLQEAQEELKKIQEKPDAVRTAAEAVEDAMDALLDATHSWVEDMTKAFDTFMDGFVPFRSWYEDNGSLWRNMVGTKAERQQAFGQFMDDLKKTIREEYMQQVRAKMTKWLADKKEKADKEKEAQLQAAAQAQTDKEFYDNLYKTRLELQNKYQEESLKSLKEYNEKHKAIMAPNAPSVTGKTDERIAAEQANVEADRIANETRRAENMANIESGLDIISSDDEQGVVIEQHLNTLIEIIDQGLDDVISNIQAGFNEWQLNSPEIASVDGVDVSSYSAFRSSFDEHKPDEQITDENAIENVHSDNGATPGVKEKSVSAIAFDSTAGSLKSGVSGAVSEATSGMNDGGVLSSLAGGAANFSTDKLQEALAKKREKRQQKETKDQKKEQDKQTKQAIESEKKKSAAVEESEKGVTAMKQAEGVAQTVADKAVNAIEVANSNSTTGTITSNETKKASTGMWGNLGRAVSEAWAEGGPYLGPALAAGVTAAVGALITMVMNMMGSSSKSSSSSTVNTKLVSGMLTYDKGNVQSFGVKRYDSGLMPILADNGRVYMAATDAESTGLITRPTLTNIGGVPALVGEEGPEMVIGRETTRALQMNRPDIMAIIQAYDSRHSRGYAKAYDSGNASSVAGSTTSVVDMQQTLAMLNQTLTAIQQNGIQAKINKYGRGGLIDEVTSGIEQTQRVGSSQRVKRIFG